MDQVSAILSKQDPGQRRRGRRR